MSNPFPLYPSAATTFSLPYLPSHTTSSPLSVSVSLLPLLFSLYIYLSTITFLLHLLLPPLYLFTTTTTIFLLPLLCFFIITFSISHLPSFPPSSISVYHCTTATAISSFVPLLPPLCLSIYIFCRVIHH